MSQLATITIIVHTLSLSLPFQQDRVPNFWQGLVWLILLVLLSGCVIAFLLTLIALLPQVQERNQIMLTRTPWRAFFIGLVNYIFLGGMSAVAFDSGLEILGLLGLIILIFLISVTALGLTGLVTLVGHRLNALRQSPTSELKAIIWGSITLILAGLLPFIGWFILTPILLMVSFGAGILGWLNRKEMLENSENW